MLGWIDIDAGASRRALELLKRLDGKDTVDQLGLGILRDRMSDLFAPATSTLMTHARYFFLIPRALRQIERESSRQNRTIEQLRNMLVEIETRQAQKLIQLARKDFKENLNGSGIIGWEKLTTRGGFVVQTPSLSYWSSIRALGMFEMDLSVDEYLSFLAAGGLKEKESKTGDSQADKSRKLHIWDQTPLFDSNSTAIDLTEGEAEYLRERYTRSAQTRSSYLAKAINSKEPKSRDQYGFAWDHDELAESDLFRKQIAAAKTLSSLMVGANRTFNLLLADRDGGKPFRKEADEDWEAWSENQLVGPGKADACRVSIDHIRGFLPPGDNETVILAFNFLETFQRLLRKGGAKRTLLSDDTFESFRVQEVLAKGPKFSRLNRARNRAAIGGNSAEDRLQGRHAPDFRWQIGWSLICDMYRLPIKKA